MPIDKSKYPANWDEISLGVKEAAGWGCELCPAKHGKKHWKTGSKVVLTTHHIDGNVKNNHPSNLIALCQRCHLRLDRPKHRVARMKKKESVK